MILKASPRSGAVALGKHLLNDRENDHVEVHAVEGFLSTNLTDAMRELELASKGVKSKQPIFSLSLSAPPEEDVSNELYIEAVRRVEAANGLTGQPKIIVFHEKDGRRHCHAAWSRIDAQTMTVKELPFFKNKCREIAKELYLENGWELPRGFVDKRERDLTSFNLAEWQICKRLGRNPRQLKSLAQESWAVSDSPAAFARALEQRGLFLAKGDRRDFVALTVDGEPFSLPRLLGKRTKELRERMNGIEGLLSVDATRAQIASRILPRLNGFIEAANHDRDRALSPLDARRGAMRDNHRIERERMDEGQRQRAQAENTERNQRLRSGLAGLWQHLTGEHRKIRQANEREAFAALKRDQAQRQRMITAQRYERAALQQEIAAVRRSHEARIVELHRDLDRQREAQRQAQQGTLRQTFDDAAQPQSQRDFLRSRLDRRPRDQRRGRDGPELER